MDLLFHPGKPLYEDRVDREDVWTAYEENLAYVITHAQDLAEELGSKSVFTADHGELFGDWLWPFSVRGYIDFRSLHHPKLVNIPWAQQLVGYYRNIQPRPSFKTETKHQ